MATGGGPFVLAEAQVRVTLDDKPFHSKLGSLHTKLQNLGVLFAKHLTVNTGSSLGRLSSLSAALDDVRKKFDAAATAANSFNRALGSGSARGLSSFVRAQGAATAQMIRSTFQGAGSFLQSSLKGLGMGLGSSARGFGSALAQSIRAVSAPIRAMGSLLTSAARSFATVLSVPLRAISSLRSLLAIGGIGGGIGGGLGLAAAGSAATQMESREVTLGRILGGGQAANQGLFKDLRTTASQMGGVSTGEVFGLAKFGAKLGLSSGELRLFTRDLAKMKVVLDDMGIEEAATRITRLGEQFRLGHHEALGMASALVRLDNMSTASGEDILNIATRMSGALSAFGAKAHQVLALSAAVREAGIPIETGGTAISQIVQRMASTKDMPRFAKVAGMGTKQFEKTLSGDPVRALIEVEKGLKRIQDLKGPVAVSRTLETLHLDGQRVRTTMLQLANVIERLDVFEKAGAEETKTHSAVMKGFAAESETTANQLERMKNNIGLLAAEAGRGLLPIIKGLASGISMLTTDLAKFFEDNRARFEEFGRKVGEVVSWVGLLFSNFKDVWNLVRMIAEEKWEQFGSIAGKFAQDMFENLKWLFLEAMPALITAGLKAGLAGIGDAGLKAIDAMLGTNLAGAQFGKGNLNNPAARQAAQPADLGIRAAPGFSMPRNLPNKGMAIGVQMAALGALARQKQKDQAAAVGMEGAKDTFARMLPSLPGRAFAFGRRAMPFLGGGVAGLVRGALGMKKKRRPQRRRMVSPFASMVQANKAALRRQVYMARFGRDPGAQGRQLEQRKRLDPKVKAQMDNTKAVDENTGTLKTLISTIGKNLGIADARGQYSGDMA